MDKVIASTNDYIQALHEMSLLEEKIDSTVATLTVGEQREYQKIAAAVDAWESKTEEEDDDDTLIHEDSFASGLPQETSNDSESE